MTEVYTAPTNGHEIAKTGIGGLHVSYPGKDSVSGHEPTVLKAGRVQSLREFFQDERDKELGRWRWPENPSYAVYELTRDRVRVVNEATGNVNDINRGTHPTRSDHSPGAAKAYFDTHPVKEPWHDAKPGEVWELTTTHIPNKVTAWSTFEGVFMDESQNWITGTDILDGRRIWERK